MKKSIRTASAALILAMLLASCSSEQPAPAETTAAAATASTETAELTRETTPDTLPEKLDFNGDTVRVHVRGDDICVTEIIAELDGDVVDDAIYNRNRKVEERLNIKIDAFVTEPWQTYENVTLPALKASIMSGDDSFGVVAGWSAKVPMLAAEGYFADLNEIKYLDFSQPWWVQSLVKQLDVNGKMYLATGDIALTLLGCSYVTYFNQKIAADFGYNDIYQLVLDGKWTIDKLSELAKGVYSDLNGNNKADKDDLFGALVTTTNVADGFLQSTGIQMIQKSKDGSYKFALESEKLSSVVEKVYALFYENEGVFNAGSDAKLDECLQSFADGHSLFVFGSLETATSTFKEMHDDYGILPYPKYDENQSEYGTRVQDGINLFCVPQSCTNTDMIGAYLEATAAESYRTVTPAYYDTALKIKYSRDDVSGQMLDIIRDGAYMNFAVIYNESLGRPWCLLRDMMTNKSTDYASWEAGNKPVFEAKLAELLKSIG